MQKKENPKLEKQNSVDNQTHGLYEGGGEKRKKQKNIIGTRRGCVSSVEKALVNKLNKGSANIKKKLWSHLKQSENKVTHYHGIIVVGWKICAGKMT